MTHIKATITHFKMQLKSLSTRPSHLPIPQIVTPAEARWRAGNDLHWWEPPCAIAVSQTRIRFNICIISISPRNQKNAKEFENNLTFRMTWPFCSWYRFVRRTQHTADKENMPMKKITSVICFMDPLKNKMMHLKGLSVNKIWPLTLLLQPFSRCWNLWSGLGFTHLL